MGPVCQLVGRGRSTCLRRHLAVRVRISPHSPRGRRGVPPVVVVFQECRCGRVAEGGEYECVQAAVPASSELDGVRPCARWSGGRFRVMALSGNGLPQVGEEVGDVAGEQVRLFGGGEVAAAAEDRPAPDLVEPLVPGARWFAFGARTRWRTLPSPSLPARGRPAGSACRTSGCRSSHASTR